MPWGQWGTTAVPTAEGGRGNAAWKTHDAVSLTRL